MKLHHADRILPGHRRAGAALALLAALLMMFVSPSAALAAPVPNDDFDNATPIGSLPFTDRVDTRAATATTDDPTSCYNTASVWYRFTPDKDKVILADIAGTNYYTALSAYTGSRGSLTQVDGACSVGYDARVAFTATANTTYYFLVGLCCGIGGTGGGDLVFSLTVPEPPANDDFTNATPIPALPFTDTIDAPTATLEPGEPQSGCPASSGTVWYAFTPTDTATITVNASTATTVAAYRGSSLTNLSLVSCQYLGPLTFRVTAGQTYYFQVGNSDDARPTVFSLDVALPPVANLYFYPYDPTSYDTVTFYDGSYDPGGVGIESYAWQFGDGATSTERGPIHRYQTDGDYIVQLMVTTSDGRTASTSRAIDVRTHDVAIVRIAAPQSASVNQARQISVEVRNTRYSEDVTVQLLRSVPGGFEYVGVLRQFVPVRPSSKTTSFTFNYTFTADDAAVGKVTFKAVASIDGARDALPADNEAVASPTKVSR
jgi:PKD repeat protein